MVRGRVEVLLRGDVDGERMEGFLEDLRQEGDQLLGFARLLRLASATALGRLDRPHAYASTMNARQIADQAQASLAEEYGMTVTVSGEGVAVLAEEWVAAGFAGIVREIAHQQAGPKVTVDGAEITVGPVASDGDLRSFVSGDDPESWTAGLAIRVIRALGGSVELDGETLRLRFPEPHSSEAAT